MIALIKQFKFFLPYYFKEHDHPVNVALHFAGASGFFLVGILGLATLNLWLVLPAVFIGYFLPHLGHLNFQKNKSMRAAHPVFCVAGAIILYFNTWKKIWNWLRFKTTVRQG